MKLKKYLGKAFVIGAIAGVAIAMGAVSAYAKTITYNFLDDDCKKAGVDLFGEDGKEITGNPGNTVIKELERAVKVNHNMRAFPDGEASEYGYLKFSEATNLTTQPIPIQANCVKDESSSKPHYIAVKAKKRWYYFDRRKCSRGS